MSERISTNVGQGAEAGLNANSAEHLKCGVEHVYHVECFGPDGQLKWEDTFHNLVTTAGLNHYLGVTLAAVTQVTAWYVGLTTGPGAGNVYSAADTIAIHGGWSEAVPYSNGTRPQWNPGSVAAGSVDNSASKAVFSINNTATVAGCFLAQAQPKSPNAGYNVGVLIGEGNFTGGDRLVQNGDTLNVTITCTQS